MPLIRVDEYAILKQLIEDGSVVENDLIKRYNNVTKESLDHAYKLLIKKKILNNKTVDFRNLSSSLKEYLLDTLEYGLTRYEIEFGDFKGYYKPYANYYSEQIKMAILKDGIYQRGTQYDVIDKGDTFIFVGLNKGESGKLNYKDRFIDSKTFQWESKINTTKNNKEGINLQNTKRVFLFVRKMKEEDNIVLPYTYLGTGVFTNMRESFTEEEGQQYPTLLFDIILDNTVPKEYHLDFDIKEKI